MSLAVQSSLFWEPSPSLHPGLQRDARHGGPPQLQLGEKQGER